jgi:hypothetical protein
MTALKVFTGLIGIIIYLPVMIYSSWLMYLHIGATELMWFLWWLQIPLMVVVQVINTIVDKIVDKDE